MNRLESTKIQKQQVQGQAEIKNLGKPPTNAELANMNPNSIVVDEVNKKLYIKGKKKNFYVTLTEV